MTENNNINPEILDECRRLAKEKGFGDAMAEAIMGKYQISFLDLDPYLRIVEKEVSELENKEKSIEDFIKNLIDEHGIDKKLLITKLTQGKFDLSLQEAKDLVDKAFEKAKALANRTLVELTPEMEDDIRQMIEREGVENFYEISHIVRQKYCPDSTTNAIILTRKVMKNMEISEPDTPRNMDSLDGLVEKEQREKELEKKRKLFDRISFVLIMLAPIFILGSLALDWHRKAIFIFGIVCFVVGFVVRIVGGEQKK